MRLGPKLVGVLVLAATCSLAAEPIYDLLLRGGHVIDPKNNLSAPMDVAIAGGKIARVAAGIPPAQARRVVDVSGLYVVPGLIDMHVHVYAGTGVKGVIAGDQSVYPDGFSFRSGVTTMVDAGSAGWRNFADFRQRVIERARTRVLAFLNIAAGGMGPEGEDDPKLLDPEAAARVAREHRDLIVGIKTAHYKGPGWISIDRALEAGRLADIPVMVDFGYLDEVRNLTTLLTEKLRPGDIYTHPYSGHREELLTDGKLNPALHAGRRRGVLFDLGHGAASFFWYVAVPAFREKFYPDIISTDLHTGSMNAGMKDLTNVMSKVLNLGVPLEEVIRMTTVNPARAIKRPDLGLLEAGAEADVTVLRLDRGNFGFLDSAGARMSGSQLLVAEMTIRAGRVEWDLNGRAGQDWTNFPYKKGTWRR